MPQYTFKCNDCNTVFDVTCRISELDTQKCNACNASALSQIISPVPFTFSDHAKDFPTNDQKKNKRLWK